ncbi:MAG: 7-cyano-7-deazaguanine synthase QueC [Desulfovibrio sp.]|jgi:7-cyano-7-deazaguanine synthase|nr:7-cyano-7-deazaguanine synthase QueC [Desulfovibrio sp.]
MTLFSGGMDSATALFRCIGEYGPEKVIAVSFRYPSKHNAHELKAARAVLEYLSPHAPRHQLVDITSCFEGFKSNLLQSGGEIPEGHYSADNMKLTVVPGRNFIFLAVAAGLAESLGVGKICIAAHHGDNYIYPDCRETFIRTAGESIALSTEGRVTLASPFTGMTKNEIAYIGKNLGVPFVLTRSCYKNQEKPCGKCGTCTERREALAAIGIVE